MAQSVLDEAVRKQLCAGAALDRIAVLDNFCWPDPVALGGERRTAPTRWRSSSGPAAGSTISPRAYQTPLVSGQGLDEERLDDGRRQDQRPADAARVRRRTDRRRVGVAHARREDRGRRRLSARDDAATRPGAASTSGFAASSTVGSAVPGGPAPYVGNRVPTVDAGRDAPALPRPRNRDRRAGSCARRRRRQGRARARSVANGHGRRSRGRCRSRPRPRPCRRCRPTSRCSPSPTAGSSSPSPTRDAPAFEALLGALPCRRIGTVTATRSLRVTLGGARRIDLPVAAMKSAYKETLAHV